MQAKSFMRSIAVSAILATALFLTTAWAADHQTILHTFGNGTDGVSPGGLVMDAAGNFYGVTQNGGIYMCGIGGCGTVFEMSPVEGGGWTETVLYSFGKDTDGKGPIGSLTMDAAGHLYGTTQDGGLHGYGTVFELSPDGGGGWSETVLHNFGGDNGFDPNDGRTPAGGLTMDAAGNLYGMTGFGGTNAEGTVYELSRGQGGGWTETVLHNFPDGIDGYGPFGSLAMDGAGNLYGTTQADLFSCNCGTVFQLSPGGGRWTETVLHKFNGDDGRYPRAGLILDAAGNLYGTAFQGGPNCGASGCGTVFELSPGAGSWTETTLYNFQDPPDANEPEAPLILDSAGNLYGTTTAGGSYYNGTVFALSPKLGGGWTETVLFSFDRLISGERPMSGLILDRAGDLYGTTSIGGTYYAGLVYELTPPSIRPRPSER